MGEPVRTWEELKVKLHKQFYLEYTRSRYTRRFIA